jgi:CheY-like chemotaxis protein
VILLTGHPMDKELDALSDLGLAAWMTKPPSLERLATALEAALERNRS